MYVRIYSVLWLTGQLHTVVLLRVIQEGIYIYSMQFIFSNKLKASYKQRTEIMRSNAHANKDVYDTKIILSAFRFLMLQKLKKNIYICVKHKYETFSNKF